MKSIILRLILMSDDRIIYYITLEYYFYYTFLTYKIILYFQRDGFLVKNVEDSKGSGVRVKSPATCKNQSGQPTKHRERADEWNERDRERGEGCDRKRGKRGKRKGKSITPRYNIYGKSMIYV